MKHTLLTLMAVAFAWLGHAQLQPVNVPIQFENESFHPSSNYRTAACGPDTVQYGQAKATALSALSINSATSAGEITQYFDCPQDITINGTDFYAWSTSGVTVPVSIKI